MFVFGTAEYVFTMAIRIEQNGCAFYAGAAARSENRQVKALLESLAQMEQGHVDVFKVLRQELPGSFPADAIWDPEGLAESYLQATADTHVFTVESAESRLQRVKHSSEVLDLALQFEKDSVTFFVGMKEILPDPKGRNEIDKLILAEMGHIRMLINAKKQFMETGTAPIA